MALAVPPVQKLSECQYTVLDSSKMVHLYGQGT